MPLFLVCNCIAQRDVCSRDSLNEAGRIQARIVGQVIVRGIFSTRFWCMGRTGTVRLWSGSQTPFPNRKIEF
jgi:hypothetical protein